MKSRTTTSFWQVAVALAVLTFLCAPATFGGDRLVVQVNEPFEVNGELYAAGKLVLREVSDYSPVATFNEISIDGNSLGVLVATASGPVAAQDEVTFTRADDGHLVLESVARRGQPTRELTPFASTIDIAARTGSEPVRVASAD